MNRKRRLPVDLSTPMDHQLTTMVIRKEDHFETVSAGDDELELERQRETDPFRPLVLVLLEQAREQMRQEKERQEEDDGNVTNRPARRSRVDRP